MSTVFVKPVNMARVVRRCFQVFKVIHQLVDSEEDILMVSFDCSESNLSVRQTGEEGILLGGGRGPEYQWPVFFLPLKVATDVITEFAADGVKYLELRSTPREEKRTGEDVNMEPHILIKWFRLHLLLICFLDRIDEKGIYRKCHQSHQKL